MNQIFFCLPLLLAWSINAQSAPVTFQSAPEQTTLLELYTSEGCSSCPPAEAWLSGLKASPGLWVDFVPLAFHVDYWDGLGWPDSLAIWEFTDRQRAYAAHWRSDSVYTPGFVVNGREWRDWGGQKELPKLTAAKAGILTVTSSDTNHWQINFAPATAVGGDYEIHAALLGGGLSSDVKAGENRGRRLNHDFAVLKLVSAPLIRKDNRTQGDFKLSTSHVSAGASLALAVWITRAGEIEPLQAVGGWLIGPKTTQ